MTRCAACGHTAPHDGAGTSVNGCTANVMVANGELPPSNVQCACDGESGPVWRHRDGTRQPLRLLEEATRD